MYLPAHAFKLPAFGPSGKAQVHYCAQARLCNGLIEHGVCGRVVLHWSKLHRWAARKETLEANDLKPFSAVRDGRRLLCILPAKVPFHSGGAQASSQRPRLPRYARGRRTTCDARPPRTVVQAKPL